MLALNNKTMLLQYIIYLTSTVSSLRAIRRILALNTHISLSNLTSRRHRVISLRAPKHFNIGKHQFILKRYSLRLILDNLSFSSDFVQNTSYSYQKSISSLRLPPTQKITHTKVSFLRKFRLVI